MIESLTIYQMYDYHRGRKTGRFPVSTVAIPDRMIGKPIEIINLLSDMDLLRITKSLPVENYQVNVKAGTMYFSWNNQPDFELMEI